MRIVIVEYGAGNVRSVLHALDRLGHRAEVSSDSRQILAADRVILPGVGNAESAMREIDRQGLRSALTTLSAPFLGICLGMQLLAAVSEEGDVACLGVVPEEVRKLVGPKKIPHVGWNRVNSTGSPDPLLRGVEGEFFYFVHSYVVPVGACTTSFTEYEGATFAASLRSSSFFGVQFHPERSGEAGHVLLKNFLML